MADGMSSSVAIVAYLALFSGVALVFLFANLLIGRFVRPANPEAEKLEIYECGEPTIGSSFVQFDLRFYVVALLFIIFDVEVAFFFPWATVFGKSTHLMREDVVVAERVEGELKMNPNARALYREMGVKQPTLITKVPASLKASVNAGGSEEARANAIAHAGAHQLALVSIVDILAFFAILMIGFFYVWHRGDLDWVRALNRERAASPVANLEDSPAEEPALSV